MSMGDLALIFCIAQVVIFIYVYATDGYGEDKDDLDGPDDIK